MGYSKTWPRWAQAALLILICARGLPLFTQDAQSNGNYTLRVPVDEVSLDFHAWDRKNMPLTHLTIRDVRLLDDRRPQRDITLLAYLDKLPIRAAFLFDISASVLKDMDTYRSVVEMYESTLLRRGDRAYVMQFDTEPQMLQTWTDSNAAIHHGESSVGWRASRYVPITAIFDTLYLTCRDQWQQAQSEATGNFILLFSDGEDNSSHVYLREAVDMCQRRHIAIYAINPNRDSFGSGGYQTLRELTSQTGGRAFLHVRQSEIARDLLTIEVEQRQMYRMVYKPSDLKRDGSFHSLRLSCVLHDCHTTARSGYYALKTRP